MDNKLVDNNDIDLIIAEHLEPGWPFPYKDRIPKLRMVEVECTKNEITKGQFVEIVSAVARECAGEKYLPPINKIIEKISHKNVGVDIQGWNNAEGCDRCIDGIGFNSDLKPILCNCPKGDTHPDKKRIPFEQGAPIDMCISIDEELESLSGVAHEWLKGR